MSYHQESYDIRHLKRLLTSTILRVTTVRANHYFKPSATMNKQGEPYKVFTSFYKAHRSKLRKHDSYAYKLKNLSDLFVKSQQN